MHNYVKTTHTYIGFDAVLFLFLYLFLSNLTNSIWAIAVLHFFLSQKRKTKTHVKNQATMETNNNKTNENNMKTYIKIIENLQILRLKQKKTKEEKKNKNKNMKIKREKNKI